MLKQIPHASILLLITFTLISDILRTKSLCCTISFLQKIPTTVWTIRRIRSSAPISPFWELRVTCNTPTKQLILLLLILLLHLMVMDLQVLSKIGSVVVIGTGLLGRVRL